MNDDKTYHDYANEGHGELPDKEVKDFLDGSSNVSIPSGSSKEEIWTKIDQATSAKNTNWYWMAAASVVLLIAAWFVFMPNQIILHETGLAETNEVALPDGSTLQLSADSKVEYAENWKERTLRLTGEGFFEVKKGEKFTVITEMGTVEVLGTSFNVIARKNKFEVACKTGKVRVSIPSKDFVKEIKPGEYTILSYQKILLDQREISKIGSWQSGEFYFDNRPVSEVFEELQRQFNVDLAFQGMEGKYFSGYFNNKELATALTMVCEPMDLTFAVLSNNQVEIRPRNTQ